MTADVEVIHWQGHFILLDTRQSAQILMTRLTLILVFVFIAAIALFVIVALKWYIKHKNHSHHSNRFSLWFHRAQPLLLLAFMIIFLLCVIGSTIHYSGRFLPVPPAKPGDAAVPLFNTTLIITGIAFFLTQVLLFFLPFYFRGKATRTAAFLPENLKLEFVWTIIPAISFIVLFLWGQKLWSQIIAPPAEDALKIEVVAEQFNWKVRYPGSDGKLGRGGFRFITQSNSVGLDAHDADGKDDFVPVQMHVPKGREVELRLWSKDVIHSFYVPFFHTKMDAVPGMVTRTHFTATATTDEMRAQLSNPDFNYEVACAELCGRMHFAMKLILVVDEPADFERWVLQQENIASNNDDSVR